MGANDSSGGGELIVEIVKEFAVSKGNHYSIVRPEAKLRENLNLTDDNIRRIANRLERTYNIVISSNELCEITTIKDLQRLVKKKNEPKL